MAILIDEKIVLKNGSSRTLRSLTPNDAESFFAFLKQAGTETPFALLEDQHKSLSPQVLRERLAASAQSQFWAQVGVFDGTRVVGLADGKVVYPDHPRFKHIGLIYGLALKSEWGLGASEVAMGRVIRYLSQKDVFRIECSIHATNIRSLSIVEKKLGFQIEGCKRKSSLINGEYVDEFLLAKLVGPLS